jgi:hypothetical protein
MKVFARPRIVAIAFAVLLTVGIVAGSAVGAHAAAKSCVRKGETVVSQKGSLYLLSRVSKDQSYASGARSMYACSSAYGRQVLLGVNGTKANRKSYVDRLFTGNRRYAAVLAGVGTDDETVSVFDLATGSVRVKVPTTSATDSDSINVLRLIVSADGVAGWTVYRDHLVGSTGFQEWAIYRAKPGGQLEQLSTRFQDVNFLRFAGDHQTLEWATQVESEAVDPGVSPPDARPGRCLRKGDHRYFASDWVVVVRRPGRGSSYKLIACSGVYHRRVLLGRFGSSHGTFTGAARITASDSAIAFVKTESKVDSTESTVMRFGLVGGRRLTRRSFGTAPVTALDIDILGSIAWVVGPRHRTSETDSSVWVSDTYSTRRLARKSSIVPDFVKIDTADYYATVSWGVGVSRG